MIKLYFSRGSDGKESACNERDLDLIPGSGRSSGEGNGNPLQYSCLENPMDRGAWRAPVHGVIKESDPTNQHSHWAGCKEGRERAPGTQRHRSVGRGSLSMAIRHQQAAEDQAQRLWFTNMIWSRPAEIGVNSSAVILGHGMCGLVAMAFYIQTWVPLPCTKARLKASSTSCQRAANPGRWGQTTASRVTPFSMVRYIATAFLKSLSRNRTAKSHNDVIRRCLQFRMK